MAAMHAALLGTGIEADDTVVVARDLYGVTRSLLMQLEQFGVSHRFVNVLEPAEVERALGETGARVLCCESISNPLLRVPNLERLVEVAHNYRAAVVLDNTFATPYLLQPLNLGVDVVVHSATKYLAGHGDVMAGYAASNRSRARRMRDVRTVTGAVLSPFEAWLTLRGIKTLPLRMERQCSSALEIATWLDEQGWVSRVYYPGLKSHHQRDVAGRLFGGRYGGMVAFELDAGQESVLRFMDALQVITSATSLGDAMSLILYPKFSSHRTLSDDQLREAGIGGSLLRLSVGLESPRDLTGDLRRAAHAAGISARESAPALPS
jgi:cystathionine beta-lyase/cystathionine gamma-synthase